MSSSDASKEPMEKHRNNAASIHICPLCKMFLQNPAQKIPCGHSYCMSCVIWLLRNILDPECLICGKKIVTDDAILNFGSIKPNETKSKEIKRTVGKDMNKNFLHSNQSDPYKDDPLLLNLNRWEHSFPKNSVPHSLALGFQHPICDADVRRGVTSPMNELADSCEKTLPLQQVSEVCSAAEQSLKPKRKRSSSLP